MRGGAPIETLKFGLRLSSRVSRGYFFRGQDDPASPPAPTRGSCGCCTRTRCTPRARAPSRCSTNQTRFFLKSRGTLVKLPCPHAGRVVWDSFTLFCECFVQYTLSAVETGPALLVATSVAVCGNSELHAGSRLTAYLRAGSWSSARTHCCGSDF